jgi:hypothetical protein
MPRSIAAQSGSVAGFPSAPDFREVAGEGSADEDAPGHFPEVFIRVKYKQPCL